jgi:hypothetical protein
VLLRLACLAAMNTFSLMRLLPMSKRELEAEVLSVRQGFRWPAAGVIE